MLLSFFSRLFMCEILKRLRWLWCSINQLRITKFKSSYKANKAYKVWWDYKFPSPQCEVEFSSFSTKASPEALFVDVLPEL